MTNPPNLHTISLTTSTPPQKNFKQKQDKIHNTAIFRNARHTGRPLIACSKGVFDLQIQWIPGHEDFPPNTKADEHAKRATKGESSQVDTLLKLLKKPLPASILALCQELRSNIKKRWLCCWKMSPRYIKTRAIDKMTPSNSGSNSLPLYHECKPPSPCNCALDT